LSESFNETDTIISGETTVFKRALSITKRDSPVVSVVLDGHTFVSPTVYLSFPNIYASDIGCQTRMDNEVVNTIIALDPSELKSVFQGPWEWRSSSYDIEDLGRPVSSEAYCGQPQFATFGGPKCSVILDDTYRPYIAIPELVKSMRPEWSICSIHSGGVYDPPIKLSSVQAITEASKPTAQPAVPAQQVTQPDAPQTQNSQPTTAPIPQQPQQPGVANGGSTAAPPQQTNPPSPAAGSSADSAWSSLGYYIASAIGLIVSQQQSQQSALATANPQNPPTQGGAGTITQQQPAPGAPAAPTPGNGPAPVVSVSFGPAGVVIGGSTTVPFSAFLAPPTGVSGPNPGSGNGGAQGTQQPNAGTGMSSTVFAIVPTTLAGGATTAVVIGTQTLVVSGTAATVGGHTISLAAGWVVIDGTATIPFATGSLVAPSGSSVRETGSAGINTGAGGSTTTGTSSAAGGAGSASGGEGSVRGTTTATSRPGGSTTAPQAGGSVRIHSLERVFCILVSALVFVVTMGI